MLCNIKHLSQLTIMTDIIYLWSRRTRKFTPCSKPYTRSMVMTIIDNMLINTEKFTESTIETDDVTKSDSDRLDQFFKRINVLERLMMRDPDNTINIYNEIFGVHATDKLDVDAKMMLAHARANVLSEKENSQYSESDDD